MGTRQAQNNTSGGGRARRRPKRVLRTVGRAVLVLFPLVLLAVTGFGQTRRKVLAAKKPFVLGVIDTLVSRELGETRTLNIYLPDGYANDSLTDYPVIYLLDGSGDEDFIHIAGLVQYATFPWVKRLPRSIVVGIANVDRRRDFTFPTTVEKDRKDFPTTGQSGKFMAFLENELQPYIEKHYSASSVKTLIGQSLGGLLATEILFKKPGLFTHYVIVSPSLWWDRESLLNYPLGPVSAGPKADVYVAVGKEGRVMEADARRLADLLKKNPNRARRVHFRYFGAEDHATIFHEAVYRAFEAFNK